MKFVFTIDSLTVVSPISQPTDVFFDLADSDLVVYQCLIEVSVICKLCVHVVNVFFPSYIVYRFILYKSLQWPGVAIPEVAFLEFFLLPTYFGTGNVTVCDLSP